MNAGAAGGTVRRRRWLRILALQAVLVALLLELALRLVAPRHDGLRGLLYRSTLPTAYDQVETLEQLLARTPLGWKPRTPVEGFVLNSRGLRTREYSDAKAPGALRVVALGDSFTFGGVPDAAHWTKLVERRLAEASGRSVEVLRLGVPATGPPFQLRLWQLEGGRLGAELVVLAFFVGNDFFDEQPALSARNGRRWTERLADLSYAFRAGRNLLRLGGELEPGVLPAGSRGAPRATGGYEIAGYDYREQRPSFTPDAYDRIEAERASLCLAAGEVRFAVRFDRTARILDALRLEVERAGARLLVAIFPDQYQVDPVVLARAARFAGNAPADYDLDRPQRRLLGHCRESGLDCLDLLPLFRAAAGRAPLFKTRDTHWSRAGHALAAAGIASALAEIAGIGGFESPR